MNEIDLVITIGVLASLLVVVGFAIDHWFAIRQREAPLSSLVLNSPWNGSGIDRTVVKWDGSGHWKRLHIQ